MDPPRQGLSTVVTTAEYVVSVKGVTVTDPLDPEMGTKMSPGNIQIYFRLAVSDMLQDKVVDCPAEMVEGLADSDTV